MITSNAIRTSVLAILSVCMSAAWAEEPASRPAAASGEQPKIVVSPESYDFGEVWKGEKAEFDMTVKNDGAGPLEVHLRPQCSCTTSEPREFTLAPGETQTLKVGLNTAKRRAGDNKVNLFVDSNDPNRARVSVEMKANVKEVLRFDPPQPLIKRVYEKGKTQEFQIKITSSLDEPVNLTYDRCEPNIFDVELKTIQAGKEYELVARTKEPLEQRASAQIYLKTDAKRSPEVRVLANVIYQERVVYTPRVLMASEKNARDQRVTLQYFGDDDNFKVTEAKCANEKVKLTVNEPTTARQRPGSRMAPLRLAQAIIVSIPSKEDLGEDAEIEILTNDPDYSRIVVLVTGDKEVYRQQMLGGIERRASQPADGAEGQEDASDVARLIRERIEKARAESDANTPDDNAEKPNAGMASGAPQITVEPALWDFGEVWYGTPLVGKLEIKNTGQSTLKIQNVQKSCGCTLADVDKKDLEPGETATLTVKYDSMKGVETVRQTVKLITNDPLHRTLVVPVQGTCKSLFSFDPGNGPRVVFGPLSENEPITKTLLIKTVYPEPINLTLPENVILADYTAELKTIKPGQEYELKVTSKTPMTKGAHNPHLYLSMDHPVAKQLRVSISGHLLDAVRIHPRAITVAPDGQKGETKSLFVYYAKDKPIKLTKIECSDERVKWQVAESPEQLQNNDAFYRITLVLPPSQQFPADGIVLNIETDSKDPQYQKFAVSISNRRTAVGTPATRLVRPVDGEAKAPEHATPEKAAPERVTQ